MHGQPELNMSPENENPDRRRAAEASDEYQVAALSAALLQSVINAYGEDSRRFAERVGVAEEVVADAVNGTCPAWELLYADFTALAQAVDAVWPGAIFATAAACDLLLSCVLNDEQCMATDVLTEPCSQDLARTLLRSALGRAGRPLLPEDVLALLRERAAALASSGSPDAWVGGEILAAGTRRGGRIDAGGTAWRMRSLMAMGHDATRIARALAVSPDLVRRLIRGDCQTVTVAFHVLACRLWDAWWDKTPPERTAAERRAATRARHQAERHNWPAAAGLDEELLDTPGYRPRCRYRPATGTGIAADFGPGQAWRPTPRRIA
jgi:hypothetical protein